MATGSLPGSYWDWASGRSFRYVKDTEEQPDGDNDEEGTEKARPSGAREDPSFAPSDLTIPFQLATADGLKTPFTNFVRG